ncbi:hypothetical protein [Candidatus Methylomicrobium oryzae]|jgi:hypothetical protein|nr:hypothetical protein [Methylomicrobium sp. RS1]
MILYQKTEKSQPEQPKQERMVLFEAASVTGQVAPKKQGVTNP